MVRNGLSRGRWLSDGTLLVDGRVHYQPLEIALHIISHARQQLDRATNVHMHRPAHYDLKL